MCRTMYNSVSNDILNLHKTVDQIHEVATLCTDDHQFMKENWKQFKKYVTYVLISYSNYFLYLALADRTCYER